ncbi:hypothetical protein WMY93_017969 [Mugilogobius chulae]|uniref:Uncharacterized protein n=1 Tax=Mugilogobius chulae TaxID=88201 RepID=A0AAW0NSR9_9GOBI
MSSVESGAPPVCSICSVGAAMCEGEERERARRKREKGEKEEGWAVGVCVSGGDVRLKRRESPPDTTDTTVAPGIPVVYPRIGYKRDTEHAVASTRGQTRVAVQERTETRCAVQERTENTPCAVQERTENTPVRSTREDREHAGGSTRRTENTRCAVQEGQRTPRAQYKKDREHSGAQYKRGQRTRWCAVQERTQNTLVRSTREDREHAGVQYKRTQKPGAIQEDTEHAGGIQERTEKRRCAVQEDKNTLVRSTRGHRTAGAQYKRQNMPVAVQRRKCTNTAVHKTRHTYAAQERQSTC